MKWGSKALDTLYFEDHPIYKVSLDPKTHGKMKVLICLILEIWVK